MLFENLEQHQRIVRHRLASGSSFLHEHIVAAGDCGGETGTRVPTPGMGKPCGRRPALVRDQVRHNIRHDHLVMLDRSRIHDSNLDQLPALLLRPRVREGEKLLDGHLLLWRELRACDHDRGSKIPR